MMANFVQAFRKTLQFEGGYTNDDTDHGGKTKYGITEAVARRHGYQGEMHNLPLSFAQKVYKVSYWDVNKLDRFTSQAMAENVFDCGVNCGTKTAAKMLQKVLGVTADGVIGYGTLTAVGEKLKEPGEKDLVNAYLNAREARYYSICKANPSQKKFLKGWLNRCESLRREIA